MKKRNVLVACTKYRDRRELNNAHFLGKYNIHFQEYDFNIIDGLLCNRLQNPPASFDPAATLKELLTFCDQNNIQAVVSTDDYPGSIYASVISSHQQLLGASPLSVLTCQHKYYSRLQQKELVPEATPDFRIIDPAKFNKTEFDMPLPIFIKPVKSCFSVLADKISSFTELEKITIKSLPPELYLQPLNWFLSNYTNYKLNSNYLLAETFLQGMQVTLEGFVQKGQVKILGIVDSVMFPGTICFQRFDYPSVLPNVIQQRMIDIAKAYVNGIEFDNSLFNIEFMYNSKTDEIHIIEVNPRIVSQFADLFEKVDGRNTYEILLDLALGDEIMFIPDSKPGFPSVTRATSSGLLQQCSPGDRREPGSMTLSRQGKYKFSSSFVLRCFENKQVKKIPNQEQIAKFYVEFPDARFENNVQEGQFLNTIIQDGKSYRYGLINLGANSRDELFTKFEYSKELLKFDFA